MNDRSRYLGVDIGGTKCAVLVGADDGEIIAREEGQNGAGHRCLVFPINWKEIHDSRYGKTDNRRGFRSFPKYGIRP